VKTASEQDLSLRNPNIFAVNISLATGCSFAFTIAAHSLYAVIKRGIHPGPNLGFAYVTSFRVEGKKMRILCKPKPLPTSEMRQRATKY
jgi:hypothetical protein